MDGSALNLTTENPTEAPLTPQAAAVRQSRLANRQVLLAKILVVVAVIGLLSVVVSLIINPHQRRIAAEDQQRQSDLVKLRNALENYAAVNRGTYPTTYGQYWCEDCTFPDYQAKGADNWIPDLVSRHIIDQLPTDPANLVGTVCRPTAEASFAGYVYYSPAPPLNNQYKLFAMCTPPGYSLNQGEAAPANPYCTIRPPYDDSNLVMNPFRDVALKPLVDPARYEYAYAIYTPGLACL